MHPNYPAMIAILPLVKRVLPQATLAGSDRHAAGRFITFRGEGLDLDLTWDKERGYALELSPTVNEGSVLGQTPRVSGTFTSPTEFETVLRALLSAKRDSDTRRPRRRQLGAR